MFCSAIKPTENTNDLMKLRETAEKLLKTKQFDQQLVYSYKNGVRKTVFQYLFSIKSNGFPPTNQFLPQIIWDILDTLKEDSDLSLSGKSATINESF